MSPDRPAARTVDDDEVVFRTLAAPGLEEDDLFAAMCADARTDVIWGDGRPTTFPTTLEEADGDEERRRRHRELLTKWAPSGE